MGWGAASLADGSSIVTGRFSDVATFWPGELGQTQLTCEGATDIYLVRYAAGGG